MCDISEDPVAAEVGVGIVDVLEVIEIDDQQGNHFVVPELRQFGESFRKGAAVGQPRERVIQRLIVQVGPLRVDQPGQVDGDQCHGQQRHLSDPVGEVTEEPIVRADEHHRPDGNDHQQPSDSRTRERNGQQDGDQHQIADPVELRGKGIGRPCDDDDEQEQPSNAQAGARGREWSHHERMLDPQ